jgi:SOS-response transcriptional repressor LexA
VKGPGSDFLTDRQREVYEWIFGFTRRHGYQPTLRDISEHFGFSHQSAAQSYVNALRRKGWVGANPGGESLRAIAFLRRPDGTPFRGFR